MYKVYEELCKEKGVTTAEVCRATGINPSTISGWKNGNYVPKAEKRQKIADYFGVSLDVLDGKKPVPLFDVSAGQGALNDTYANEFIKADDSSDEYSYCKIVGDSMYPLLQEDDIVKIHLQTETTPQDLTVIKVDGDHCTVKYVEIVENGVWLRAINKDVFQDKFYSTQEVMTLPITIIGKVEEMRRSF